MARGGGRSGGGRSSGGRSSGSRSSGGHRAGRSSSSGRSRSSSSFGSSSRSSFSGGFGSRPGGSYGGGYRPPRPSYRPPVHYGGGYHRPTTYRSGNSGCLPTVLAFVIVMVIVLLVFFSSGNGGFSDVPASTVNREKVNTGVAFTNDCIVDEAGWIDDESYLSRGLQDFYNKTGIQPFIYIKAYDPDLRTDEQKEEYAVNWYETNIDNEGTFLYVYFEEQDDYGDGYMCYVNGTEITTVMDAEAIDIFWAYIDSVWESSMDDEDMFIHVFTKTADRIMDKSTTGADVGKWVVIAIVVIAAGVIVIKVMKTKRQHEKEANEETERILNTPLGNTTTDDLADKYAGVTTEENKT